MNEKQELMQQAAEALEDMQEEVMQNREIGWGETLEYQIIEMKEKIVVLQQQIYAMRNHENCKYYCINPYTWCEIVDGVELWSEENNGEVCLKWEWKGIE